ncbi:n-acetylglucosamine-6-phosphate deacetylase-like protein [Lindgomyces ingoldianus]|uniref:N-acetylglucosamine-6-phosphate deacetylase-like protein n=1 Tax=Lindgomyces ingoldianus TaxID=673940 RepID=A0ACB6R1Q1_9PLEO|nr:n-acetylglucosamine-6-phosphate deacetylase-like protein [Lindgomyces ingoldianus]KAF2473254.1 n-acetylglucosamine-6-phosphate deacetylase-like protein [Lindgomyces ingoldianus]
MPSIVPINSHDPHSHSTGVIKFTNCLLVKGNNLVKEDLWISSLSGKILNGQEILYGARTAPDSIIDLDGRILAPGLIDVQLNGAYGFDFSVIPEDGTVSYGKGVRRVNRNLIRTGVTSYLPTLTSQRPEVYQQALPFLGPPSSVRDPTYGSESLGAHCEGPFINPNKNGIHNVSVLRTAPNGLTDLATCYGATYLQTPSPIKLLTLAPELPGALSCVESLTSLGITVSIGHSDASYEEAKLGIKSGATMITHLFNAMKPLHHRNPGIFGLLGTTSSSIRTKPYFGIIADGIHLHPTSIKIAWNAHPEGLILVTDAMRLAGMPDGTYDWTNGSRIIKKGALLTLEENGKIAGSSIKLIECVTNFLNWTGASVPEALKAVTETPAKMLGLQDVKGTLKEGADADLVVLNMQDTGVGQDKKLVVDQVWKFGEKVFERE